MNDIVDTLRRIASDLVKNPNPKGRKKMVTKEYAENWLRENRGTGRDKGESIGDKAYLEKEKAERDFQRAVQNFKKHKGTKFEKQFHKEREEAWQRLKKHL